MIKFQVKNQRGDLLLDSQNVEDSYKVEYLRIQVSEKAKISMDRVRLEFRKNN